jgi:hypothetical protein
MHNGLPRRRRAMQHQSVGLPIGLWKWPISLARNTTGIVWISQIWENLGWTRLS